MNNQKLDRAISILKVCVHIVQHWTNKFMFYGYRLFALDRGNSPRDSEPQSKWSKAQNAYI